MKFREYLKDAVKYNDMKSLVFAKGRIPEGYRGDMKDVMFAYNPTDKFTYVVHEHGYFKSAISPTNSKEEAFMLLKKHYLYKNITKI